MAGTYSQIYLQVVFAVKGRENLIAPSWKEALHKYISGIVTAKEQKSIIVNGMPDHIHAFVGLKPSMRISDLVRDMKNNSSKFINESGFIRSRFSWQEGYAIFTVSWTHVLALRRYIANQEAHHKRASFIEELIRLLEKNGVEYDPKYLL